jgi:NADH:ubiquinone oxidoreductase subunit K
LHCHSIAGHRKAANQLAVTVSLVAAVWLAAVSRWIVRDAVVPWDSKNQFYAFFRFLSGTLRSGDSPFWNPYHYGGHPSVADPQSLVFSPVFVAWGLLDPAPTMRAFDLVVLAHLLAGGIAIAALGWRAQWPIPSSVLAAALFMFGGAASGRLQHSGIILGYGLFPVALLLLELALERRSHVMAVGFAIIAAGVALGRNQVALLLCGLLLAAAVANLLASARAVDHLRGRLGVLATMAATGGVLLIVPMLLTLQFAQLSNRPAESLDDALRGSLYPANLATLAVANIFGTHQSYWGPGAATLPEVALTDDSENYLFVGAVPILLLLWFGLAAGGAWRSGRRLMTATLAIACLFMLGRYTPFYGLAFRFVPGIDLFRRPTDASFVFNIALAFLVGQFLSDYVRKGLPNLRPKQTIAAISALLVVMAGAIVFSARTGHASDAAREFLIGGVVMVVATLILFGARRSQNRHKGLMGMLLRYPYEVRQASEYFDDIQDVKITKEMLDLARHIVESKSGHLDPTQFEDHYEAALQDLLERKKSGLPIAKRATPTGGNVFNLMDALKASLKGGKREPAPKAGRARKKPRPGRSAKPAKVPTRIYLPCIPTRDRRSRRP